MRGEVLELEVDKYIDSELEKRLEKALGEAVEKAVEEAVEKTEDNTGVKVLYTIVGLSSEEIAEKLNFSIEKVNRILEELKLLPA